MCVEERKKLNIYLCALMVHYYSQTHSFYIFILLCFRANMAEIA